MMAYKRSENTRDNFDKFIYQLQIKTKILTRKLERILMNLCSQNVSLLFNQTCLNERKTSAQLYTHTHTHTYIDFHLILILVFIFIIFIV